MKFVKETHTYIKDGIVLKSVTQILKELFPSKYEGIPEGILKEKSEYGTKVHKCIEILEKSKSKNPLAYVKQKYKPNAYQLFSINEYLRIKKEYNIEITDSERMVSYKHLYAGTLDLKGYVNGKSAIIDIKTTYEADINYVSWQNSLYELASEPVDKLYLLWLPKCGRGQLFEVGRIDKELILALIGDNDEEKSMD